MSATPEEIADRLDALLALREKAELATTSPFRPGRAISWSICERFIDGDDDLVANSMSFNVAEFFSEASNQSPDLLRAAAALIRAQAERVRVLEARVASLEATLKHVRQTLCVPAAEYVPAIRDCFDIIDAALAKAGAPQ